MPHDYPTQHVTDANAGAYPTMHSTNMITESSAASSSHVNISYQAVLQALQGRRHEPLDRALEPPEELRGPMRHFRGLGSQTPSLRQDNRGWENMWVQVIRLVLARGRQIRAVCTDLPSVVAG